MICFAWEGEVIALYKEFHEVPIATLTGTFGVWDHCLPIHNSGCNNLHSKLTAVQLKFAVFLGKKIQHY